MPIDMSDWQGNVSDRKSLAQFIRMPGENLRLHPDQWENEDLGSYLEAMAAWLEDMDGYCARKGLPAPDVASWELFAKLLEAARLYEQGGDSDGIFRLIEEHLEQDPCRARSSSCSGRKPT